MRPRHRVLCMFGGVCFAVTRCLFDDADDLPFGGCRGLCTLKKRRQGNLPRPQEARATPSLSLHPTYHHHREARATTTTKCGNCTSFPLILSTTEGGKGKHHRYHRHPKTRATTTGGEVNNLLSENKQWQPPPKKRKKQPPCAKGAKAITANIKTHYIYIYIFVRDTQLHITTLLCFLQSFVSS